MEFHEKLQNLRRQRGLTQEELARALYVSRTAVSKWESGRGYPGIDSLRAIAAWAGVSIDSLLSTDEVITIAQTDRREQAQRAQSVVFGLLDTSCVLFFILPFFALKAEGVIRAVPLALFSGSGTHVTAAYWLAALLAVASGIVNLIRPDRRARAASLGINAAGVLLFILSPQPYAAAMLFVFLFVKAVLLVKKA